MNITEFVTLAGLITTLVLSIVAIYKAFRVTPKEVKITDAELSEKYEQLADKSLARAVRLQERVDNLEQAKEVQDIDMKTLQQKVEEQQREILILKRTLEEFILGIKILIRQLEDCNQEPAWQPDKEN
jgi:small-conductance mechanosensitive channel